MKIYRMAILMLALLVPVVAASPAFALNANSMWIEPPALNYNSSTPIGTLFNVTVWMNVTSPVNNWQFMLTYDGVYLNATRCGYTGDGKSLWSGTNRVDAVDPSFDVVNGTTTYRYVLHGEVLKSSVEATGAGALSWVEFNVTTVLPNATKDLRLDGPLPFNSQAAGKDFVLVSPALTFDISTYVIPEFPLTALLFAMFMVTASIAFVFRKRIGKTPSY